MQYGHFKVFLHCTIVEQVAIQAALLAKGSKLDRVFVIRREMPSFAALELSRPAKAPSDAIHLTSVTTRGPAWLMQLSVTQAGECPFVVEEQN
jgi:hypothetical protein